MAFNRRIITKELDMANLAKHNDNYADIKTELDGHDTKIAANKSAVEAAQSDITTHKADTVAHLSADDRVKFDGVTAGAEPNQNAFAQVNDVVAAAESDTLTIEGGTGITVSTNPTTKKVIVTATGEATPGPHGPSHNIDGADPIPDLATLRSDFDALTPADIGAASNSDLQAIVIDTTSQLRDMAYNVKTFGATGDGVTDDTIAIKEAINSSPEGSVIYFPPGKYVTSKLSIQKPMKIMGAGCGSSIIMSSSLTEDLFHVSSHYVTIQDIKITNTQNGNGTGGAAIKLDSNATKCAFEGLVVSGFYDGINIESGVIWTVERCYIVNNKRYGIYIRNIINGDTGDGIISKCTFDSELESISAVRHESGGGLKLSLNKILGHYYGYDLQVEDGVNTSVLIINGNSIEGQKYSHIRMGRKGTTGNYSSIAITGNQHAGGVPLGLSGYDVGTSGISLVSIVGNILNGAAGSAAVTLNSGLSDVVILGNVFGTWDYAVIMNAGSQRVKVGSNEIANILVDAYHNSGINNKVETTAQTGSASGTTSNVANYGAFYSATITISFPIPFKSIPKVVASVSGSTGGVGVTTSAATKTGVVLFVFGLNPSALIEVDWVAEGVL